MKAVTAIHEVLPHREPFLFVDTILHADTEGCVAEYTFRASEPFFAGHFPQYPVVPGVLLIEALAQAGGAGLSYQKTFDDGTVFFLAAIHTVKLRSRVLPNDTLRMEIQNLRVSKQMIRQKGAGYVGTTLAIEAEWMCLAGSV